MLQIESHKLIYKHYLDDLRFYRSERVRNQEHHAYNNPTEIGLKTGGGVKPQHLTIDELYAETNKAQASKFQVNPEWQLIGSEELAQQEQKLIKSSTNLKKSTVPVSLRDKDKVNLQLTPAQIYKIIVSPSVLDFGDVCVKSQCIKHLDFFNTLEQPIHVELETNECTELRHTSPLGQVIQPQTKGTFPILFESDYVQTFQRSISYRVNYSYRHHIIILADAQLPRLTLSTSHCVLNQLTGVQPDLCYRTNVTVSNPFNATAEFTWVPIYGEQGTAFSIRPASGLIEPFKELDCEIVWHGSYLAPLKGTFSLQVTGGEASTLTCESKLGSTQLQFINRRANFGKIPVNMTSVKTFYLTNTGTHNAFFQIMDVKPIRGRFLKEQLSF